MDKRLAQMNNAPMVFFAQLRHTHCKISYLEEDARRICRKSQLYILQEAIWSNILSKCVFVL